MWVPIHDEHTHMTTTRHMHGPSDAKAGQGLGFVEGVVRWRWQPMSALKRTAQRQGAGTARHVRQRHDGGRREGRVQFWHAGGATGWPEQGIAAVDRNAWYITPLKLFPEWHRSGQSEGEAGCARILET